METPFVDTYPKITVVEKPTVEFVQRYSKLLPIELLDIWQKFGWGIYMDGFLRIVNPEELNDFIEANVEVATPSIPFAVTAFGDVLLWLNDGYVECINFRKGYRDIVESGMNLFLNDTLLDFDYTMKELRAEQYVEAKKTLGIPAYDQCYGYVPLLALGGSERVANLQIVALQTHLELMAQVVGSL